MSARRRLQRRYERLLGVYPPEYRADHAAEMLGTLLDAARPGQRLPSPREVVGLVVGGLRVRARLAARRPGAYQWLDGLRLGILVLVLELLAVGISLLLSGAVLLAAWLLGLGPSSWLFTAYVGVGAPLAAGAAAEFLGLELAVGLGIVLLVGRYARWILAGRFGRALLATAALLAVGLGYLAQDATGGLGQLLAGGVLSFAPLAAGVVALGVLLRLARGPLILRAWSPKWRRLSLLLAAPSALLSPWTWNYWVVVGGLVIVTLVVAAFAARDPRPAIASAVYASVFSLQETTGGLLGGVAEHAPVMVVAVLLGLLAAATFGWALRHWDLSLAALTPASQTRTGPGPQPTPPP